MRQAPITAHARQHSTGKSRLFSRTASGALHWTEAGTEVAASRVPVEAYREARAQFSEKELVDLIWLIVTINGWNRITISFRRPPEDI